MFKNKIVDRIRYKLLQLHKWHKDWLGCWMCECKMHHESYLQEVII